MGISYADGIYVVNYEENEVYALSEFYDYIEEKGKEVFFLFRFNGQSAQKFAIAFVCGKTPKACKEIRF